MNDHDDYVKRLLSDVEFYRDKAQEEAATWGRIHSDPKLSSLRDYASEPAQRPAEKLGSPIGLGKVLDLLPKPARVLSLACGEGRTERLLFSNGLQGSVVAFDLSEQSIDTARRSAAALRLPIEYVVADIQHFHTDEQFDLVVSYNFLHHIVHLEDVLDKIEGWMKPQGLLYVRDFIGEARFQWSGKRLDILNGLFQSLPERLRYSHRFDRVMPEFTRPDPARLASPFEAIRSDEIAGLIKKKFDVVALNERNALFHLLFATPFRPNYAVDDDSSDILNMLIFIDNLLIKEGILPPLSGEYVARRKQAGC